MPSPTTTKFPPLSEIWATRRRYPALGAIFWACFIATMYLFYVSFKLSQFSALGLVAAPLVGLSLGRIGRYADAPDGLRGPLFYLQHIYMGLYLGLAMTVFTFETGAVNFVILFTFSGVTFGVLMALFAQWSTVKGREKRRVFIESLALEPGSALDHTGVRRLVFLAWPAVVVAVMLVALILGGSQVALFFGAACLALTPQARKVDQNRINPAIALIGTWMWWVIYVALVGAGGLLIVV